MRLIDKVYAILQAEDKTREQKADGLHGLLEFACLAGDTVAQGACILALWVNADSQMKSAVVEPTHPWSKHLSPDQS